MIVKTALWRPLLCLSASLAAVGCGGGGGGSGGGSGVSVSFSPRQLTATVAQFESSTISVSAKLSHSISGPIYVYVTDAAGIIQPEIGIDPSDETHVTATFELSENLPAGVQTGTLTVALCGDAACTDRLGGGALPYSIIVQNGSNLTPLTPLVGAGDWTTPNGNVEQNHYVPVSLNPSDFSLRWIWSAPKYYGTRQPLVPTAQVTSAGRVFAMGNRGDGTPINPFLVSLRESDGQAEWKDTFPSYSFQGMPSADASGLYMLGTSLGGDYQLSSIDPATGQFRYSTILAGANGFGVSATPLADRVIAHQGNALFAMDKTTGTILWQRPGAGAKYVPSDGAQVFRADYLPGNVPPYFTTALDVQTGADLGSTPTNNYFDKQIMMTPDHTRAVVMEDTRLDVIDASTYQDVISIPVSQNVMTAAVTDTTAYVLRVGQYGGAATLEAFNLATAESLWSVSVGTPDSAGIVSLIATNSHVFVSVANTVSAIGTTSHVAEWTYTFGGRLALSANGILYISQVVPPAIQSNGRVVAINLH